MLFCAKTKNVVASEGSPLKDKEFEVPYATCNIYIHICIYVYKKIHFNMHKANFIHDIHQAT